MALALLRDWLRTIEQREAMLDGSYRRGGLETPILSTTTRSLITSFDGKPRIPFRLRNFSGTPRENHNDHV